MKIRNSYSRRKRAVAALAAGALGLGVVPLVQAVERPGGPGEAEFDQTPTAELGAQGFLGVYSVAIDPLIARQLQVESGLLIQEVSPDSPAAAADLRQGDVLLSVGSQSLVDEVQLREVIGSSAPGEEVEMEILRGGGRETVKVTLGERPAPEKMQGVLVDPREQMLQRLRERHGDQFFNDFFDQLQPGFGQNAFPDIGDTRRLLDQMRQQLGSADSSFSSTMRSSETYSDGEGSVTLESDGESKTVTIRDRGGEVLWSGPWTTREERAKVPEEYAGRLAPLEQRDPATEAAPKEGEIVQE